MKNITRKFFPAAFFLILAASIVVADKPNYRVIELWPNGAPGATGTSDEDKPAIIPVLPDAAKATGAAILILIINLIGYGIGPPLLGEAANYFTAQQLAPVGLSLADCRGVEDGVCAAARAGGLKTALLCVVCILAWPIAHFLLAGRSLLEDRVS